MPKFFILATKQVELRGIVTAVNYKTAEAKAKTHWMIYDHFKIDNCVTAGTTAYGEKAPEIAEFEAPLKVLHVQDIRYICIKCGLPLRKHKDGKCPI